jgi:hypothetical protein
VTSTLVYPAPTIVLGVGRMGLAVLERLAEDWHRLRLSSADPSLKNLRLIYVRSQDDGSDPAWRDAERSYIDLARYTGDGDLPSLALDLVILRSLGLVRYHNGAYQVALPRDAGFIERGERAARRRFFEWMPLHPDPIAAAERLAALVERHAALNLFVKPLTNRVRQGNSPRTLLRCISRVRALQAGRDPSPWLWFNQIISQQALVPGDDGRVRVQFAPDWAREDDLRGYLDGFAPPPMPGWDAWRHAVTHDDPAHPTHELDLLVPAAMLPQPNDLPSPLRSNQILRVDWETNGWATLVGESRQEVEFAPIDASMYRLGLFDHDGSSRIHTHAAGAFADRLRALGAEADRGLVRLWVDLQRNRVEDQGQAVRESRQHDGVEETLRQSLEIVGELVVRPLMGKPQGESLAFPHARQDNRHDKPLPLEPSSFLAGLELDRAHDGDEALSALASRLAALGISAQHAGLSPVPLMRQLRFTPQDVREVLTDDNEDPRRGSPGEGLYAFRSAMNEETRNLFQFSFLSRYRHKPTRRPPRLTVYVVGDVGEPFVRSSVRVLLREIHAELLRAYAPIFETFREGFDRALCVTPILWMPHPADAFGGMHPVRNRCEEAAIIEAIQGIRRWVETIPRGTRCIPQVILNSRVTDNAVLSPRDAVRQSHDFISFQIRNDQSQDVWLRNLAVGPIGDDFFASFSCHAVEFPAERAREYLANRLARDCIRQLKVGEQVAPEEPDAAPLGPPEVQALLKPSTGRTRQTTRRAADSTGALVEERIVPKTTTARDALLAAFDEGFERELMRQIHQQWRALTRSRGDMDAMMDALRRETSSSLVKTLDLVRKTGDRLVEQNASPGGLKAAQAGFQQLEAVAREHLSAAEEARHKAEELCRVHSIPQTQPVQQGRAALVALAATKPDHRPMILFSALWLCMAAAMGAPLAHALARALALDKKPNIFEILLGPGGFIVGMIALTLPLVLLLKRHMDRIVRALHEQISQLAETARGVVEGVGASFGGAPSIRSFIEARLHLTAALAIRSYALRVYERVLQDAKLAHRLSRSIDIQEDVLMRRAEDLGVRAQMGRGGELGEDDLEQLFLTRGQQSADFLLDPRQLVEYYRARWGDPKELQAVLPIFVDAVGGFGQWRKHACMSDTDRIMSFTRDRFQELVDRPVAEQYSFEEVVGASLVDFVARHYSNIGFGAKFMGYEGLDPDNVQVLCDTALVIHPALLPIFQQAKRRPGARPFTETLQVIEASISPNSAYMLSFAQGIRPHSIRNLMRFESYHDRLRLPDDRSFPMSSDGGGAMSAAINHLTGFSETRVKRSETADAARDVSEHSPDVSGTADPASGTADPASGTADPASGTVAPVSGTVDPVSGTVAPVSGTVAPVSGTVAPVSGTVAPASGTADPVLGTADPASGTVDPVSEAVEPVAPALSTALRPLPAVTAAMATMSEQELDAAMRALEKELKARAPAPEAVASAPAQTPDDEPSDG